MRARLYHSVYFALLVQQYNRQRSKCKECGGSNICEHNRLRCQCKQCCGSSICEHNSQRNNFKQCGGWVEHLRAQQPKKQLQVIRGSSICAERIYGITYHISSSPYYSEDMHTKYTVTLPKGVMTQGITQRSHDPGII